MFPVKTNVVKSQGFKLDYGDGEVVKEIGEAYKYLGVIEAEKIKEVNMKETFQKEYLRRACLVLQSKR